MNAYNKTITDYKHDQHYNHHHQQRQEQKQTVYRAENKRLNAEADKKILNNDSINQEIHSFEKVLVIGLGQLGLPVAKYVREKGFDTYGYDVSETAKEKAERIADIKKATNFRDIDVYIICVSTHKPEDMSTPQIDGLLSIVQQIANQAKNGALVSIESTIPRGTSKKVFEMLNHRLHVAHIPHRWYALEEKEHGVNQLRVIGGVCDCCLKAAMKFYSGHDANIGKVSINSNCTISNNNNNTVSGSVEGNSNNPGRNDNLDSNKNLGIPLHPVSNVEIAEITKIAENADRYLQIAFAEDLYLYCQANSINFPELREALNTKWNVNILEPRDGIGGHCLPKDTEMFLQSSESSAKSKILTAAFEVDRAYRRYRQVRSIASQQISKQSLNSELRRGGSKVRY
jgi:UDP-N-acetyl-D-mannosaminuronic acid dehydrogenase